MPIKTILFIFLLVISGHSAEWSFLGPNKGTPLSHSSFYQNPAKPNILLVASRGEKSTKGGKNQGLWRSEDSGKTWQLIDPKIGFMINNNEGLVAHPANPDLVFLTQEFTPDFCFSKDGGKTWTKINKAGYKHGICIGLHPVNQNIVWVGADDGLWKSVNGGKTFSPVRNNGLPKLAKGISNTVVNILINPLNPEIMYIGFLYANMKEPWGVYKSTNGGKTFKPVNNGLPEGELILDLTKYAKKKDAVKMALPKYGLQYKAVKDITMDRLNPETLYAVTRQNGLFKSSNGGESWKNVFAYDPKAAKEIGRFPTAISVHPKYPNVLFLGDGGMNVHVSTDGGNSWKDLGSMVKFKKLENGKTEVILPNGQKKTGDGLSAAMGHHYYSSVHKIHVDINNERKIYATTDQGIYTMILPESFVLKK